MKYNGRSRFVSDLQTYFYYPKLNALRFYKMSHLREDIKEKPGKEPSYPKPSREKEL